jgi:hypothetical protein
MLATRPIGRGLVTVGALALSATVVLGVLPVAGLPPLVVLVVLVAAAVALLTSVIGSVHVGLLLANGSQGAPGLAGPALWARAACIATGVGQVVAVALAAVDSILDDRRAAPALLPAWDVCLTVFTVLATVAVGRSGALRGFARWSLAFPAAAQAAIAVVELVPGPALLTVLSGVVLPAALVVAGIAFVRDAAHRPRATSDPAFRTRLGRTTGEWELDAPVSVATARLRVLVTAQSRCTLVRLDEATTGTDAELSARANWAAWGGRIHLRLEPLADGRTRVRARWNPALVTAVLTWDQGERDLHRTAAGLAAGPVRRPESLPAAPR